MSEKTVIGIDTGVNTGLAVWHLERREFIFIASMKIHSAMGFVDFVKPALVRVEDARQRRWFGSSGAERWKGAGSIMRDCQIWEDFLTAKEIPFEMVAPKDNLTKLSAKEFQRLTGWMDRTNEHGRDAAGLVFQLKLKNYGKQNKNAANNLDAYL